MIIIPSGNSATFTLAANNQLTVTSRGGTTVTGPGGLLGTIDGTMTFGSYGGDTIITIAAAGNDCEYWVIEPEPAMLTTDANNNTVLVGADGIGYPVSSRFEILNGASAGQNSGWLPLSTAPERFVYQLDSGTTTTTFSVDISADGSTSLGQAFTGTYASSTVAEITFPIMYSNPLAKFFRFNVVSGGPLSVSRGA